MLVVVSKGLPQERFDELRREVPEAELVQGTDETVADLVSEVDAILGCPRRALPSEVLARAPRLRWVHVGGAGVDEFLYPEFVESAVTLTNGRALQGPEVADHALALLLALTRNIHHAVQGLPPKAVPRPVELRGKTAVVVGVGGIGLLAAERAHAFGMRVIGVDANVIPLARCLERTVLTHQLDDVLPEADAVLLTAPATLATRHLFDRARFGRIKRGGWFVNVSRGTLVDTDALVGALEDGRLAGAGLDVTDPEPLPEGHSLRKMPNVILTPHQAGLSDGNRQRAFELTKENLRRFARGAPLLNVVDKRRGY